MNANQDEKMEFFRLEASVYDLVQQQLQRNNHMVTVRRIFTS